MEVEDLDLDGRPDIVVPNGITRVISLIFNNTLNPLTRVPVDVPDAVQLAIAGSIPNPARGDLVLAFTLTDRSAATLELFDVTGRRVLRREVGGLGIGSHRMALGTGRRLDPGVYFVRLTQRERSVTARTVVTER